MRKFYTKQVILVLCLLMALSTIIPAFGANHSNDYENHWAKDTIAEALSSGKASGYPDGTFKPDNFITRGEFFSLVNRTFNFTNSSQKVFDDVASDAWYAPAVAKADAAGYISGYPDGNLYPEQNISRQELASILSRIKSLTGTSSILNFTDGASFADWSKDSILAIAKAKIMIGYPDNSFRPETHTTRAEALVAITRAFNYINPEVSVPVNSLSITDDALTLIVGGSSRTINPTINPENATIKDLFWTSSDTNVATVVNGVVTPVAEGTAIITVTSASDSTKTAEVTVTVNPAGPIVPVQPVTPVEPIVPVQPTEPTISPVQLGMAGDYVILAKTGISTIPNSVITGDIGVSPISATGITGFSLTVDASNMFATSTQVTGKVYASTYSTPTPSNLTTAISNMETAYTDAAGRAVNFTELYSGDLSGKTLVPGVYKWGTGVLINSDITLNGGPNDVWIFQIGEGITQANGTRINLTGGAQAKNIFWQVAESVSIGTGSHFEGIVLSQTNITMGTNSSINGRLLAQTAVTLDASTVVAP